jgi:hypothetical protein
LATVATTAPRSGTTRKATKSPAVFQPNNSGSVTRPVPLAQFPVFSP